MFEEFKYCFYVFLWVKEGCECTYVCICMGTHIDNLYNRTAWWMFMKLCTDEVLMAAHMFIGFSPDPPGKMSQRRLQRTYSSDEKTLLGMLPLCFLCRLRSIAAHRDHFVGCLSVSVRLFVFPVVTFLVVRRPFISHATFALLVMLPCW